ncbi:hypothetical protein ACFWWC_17275 [Streptomyces sp. NPDC058642]
MRELFSTAEFAALADGSGCDLGFQRGYRIPGSAIARSGRAATVPPGFPR